METQPHLALGVGVRDALESSKPRLTATQWQAETQSPSLRARIVRQRSVAATLPVDSEQLPRDYASSQAATWSTKVLTQSYT